MRIFFFAEKNLFLSEQRMNIVKKKKKKSGRPFSKVTLTHFFFFLNHYISFLKSRWTAVFFLPLNGPIWWKQCGNDKKKAGIFIYRNFEFK